MELPDLVRLQNRDGGWPFRAGVSCVEPTALAAVAVAASGSAGSDYERAVAWLRSLQRPDGGWPPMRATPQSTWVTSLVLLIPAEHLGKAAHLRGVQWLLKLQGQETTLSWRLQQRLRGQTVPPEEVHAGWPFFPGAAAWVSPTACAVLALRKAAQIAGVAHRVAEGREFLLARRCVDGGWNHGSARPLGIEADSYPETTGLALLALQGVPKTVLEKSLGLAQRYATTSSFGESAWLRLALSAHGIPVPPAPELHRHDVRDAALAILADCAARGRNVFV